MYLKSLGDFLKLGVALILFVGTNILGVLIITKHTQHGIEQKFWPRGFGGCLFIFKINVHPDPVIFKNKILFLS